MTIQSERLKAKLRAFMKAAHSMAIPSYAADPLVQRRVGRMLADTAGMRASERDFLTLIELPFAQSPALGIRS